MSTTYNSDGSVGDVQAKLNAAADGDTVVLPVGTFIWPTGVTITKNVTLQGSGYTASSVTGAPASVPTIVYYTGTGIAISVTMSSTLKGKTLRISGIKFQGITTPSSQISYLLMFNTPTSDAYRIDNCIFDAGATIQVNELTMYGTGAGLVDHCTFLAGNASEIIHNTAYNPDNTAGWTNDLVPGSSAFVYIEDCIFTKNPQLDTAFWGTSALQSYYGARSVVRYCTFNYCQIDQHGGGGAVGARWFEFYRNTFVVPFNSPSSNQSNFFGLRAGSGFVYDNVATTGPNDGSGCIQLYSDDAANPPPYGPGAGIFVGGNPNGIKSPVYLWNNTQTVVGSAAQIPVIATSANVTAGVNYITGTSRPGTLTVAQTAATAGGAAFSYSAYTYPHPLIAAASGGDQGGGSGGGGGGGGGGTGGGSGGGVSSQPFMPVKFLAGPPTAMVWEDGPGFFVNPSNTGTPVRYSGQSQTSKILAVQPKPPTCTLPGAAIGMSTLPSTGTPVVPPIIPPPPTSYTLGDTAIEATLAGWLNANTLYACPITVLVASRLQSISLYISNIGANTNLRLGVYSGSASVPSTLVAEMNGSPLALIQFGAVGWYTLSLSTPVAVVPGTYWLTWNANTSNIQGNYKTGMPSGSQYSTAASAASPMPATWPGGGSPNTVLFSLYATLLTP